MLPRHHTTGGPARSAWRSSSVSPARSVLLVQPSPALEDPHPRSVRWAIICLRAALLRAFILHTQQSTAVQKNIRFRDIRSFELTLCCAPTHATTTNRSNSSSRSSRSSEQQQRHFHVELPQHRRAAYRPCARRWQRGEPSPAAEAILH